MDERHDVAWTAETTRRDAAALLRDLADGVDAGEIAIDEGDGAAGAAGVPERLQAELELERTDDEVELEVELSWPRTERDDLPRDETAEETTDDGEAGPRDDAEDPTGDDTEIPEILTDDDGPSGSRATFEVYRDRADEWRWRLVHDNGNIIADGGEGYARRATALNGLRSVQHNAPAADVEVDGD